MRDFVLFYLFILLIWSPKIFLNEFTSEYECDLLRLQV